MLVGPPVRPTLPALPGDNADLEAIRRYIKDLDTSLSSMFTSVVQRTVGAVGLLSLSGTGVAAHNFSRLGMSVGNQTSVTWIFTNPEPNPTYAVFQNYSTNTGVVLTGMTKTTTNVTFTYKPSVPSGVMMDVVL